MALSREEARNIGKGAAEKVLKLAQGCSCGVATWYVRANVESLASIIESRQYQELITPRVMEGSLDFIEKECGVDLSKAREEYKKLQAEVKKENWDEAQRSLSSFRALIINPLEECASEKEKLEILHGASSNPGVTVKHYWVERNEPPGQGWAIVEAWYGGTVRSPFDTKEEAIKREEEIWSPEYTKQVPSPQEKFPKQHEALKKLYPYSILEYHDDGDLTIQELVPDPKNKALLQPGQKYVVTIEGEVFAHHTTKEALKKILGNPGGEKLEKYYYLGEDWDHEYSTAECVVYRSADGKKRLYVYYDGSKEVKPAPPDTSEEASKKTIVTSLSTEKGTHPELEVPVARAVEALIKENPWSSGFHGALNQRWTIVFKGKISDRAIKTAKAAGLEVSYRPIGTPEGVTDVSLPGVDVSEIEKATQVFNRFAELYEGSLLGTYRYKEQPEAEKARSYAEGLGYKATLQRSGDEWELIVEKPHSNPGGLPDEEGWVYAKVGTTEVRGRRDPTGIAIEQVSPTYDKSDFDKAVKIIEEALKKTLVPLQVELSFAPGRLQREIRVEVRKIPVWKLKEAYQLLLAGEIPDIDILQKNKAYAWSAVKEILWERGELEGTGARVGKERMPRVNPHATAIEQDKQLVEQMKWLKEHGFETASEAQEAGY